MPAENLGFTAWPAEKNLRGHIERRRVFVEKLRTAFGQHGVSVIEAEPGRMDGHPILVLTLSRPNNSVETVRVSIEDIDDPLDVALVDPIVETVATHFRNGK